MSDNEGNFKLFAANYTDRIISLLCCAAQGGCGMSLLLMVLLTNFSNVNNP